MAPGKRTTTTSSRTNAALERVVTELREANERLVAAGIQLHEMTEEAEARRLQAEAATAEADTLRRLGVVFSQELDHQKLVQRITDEATALCGANFGAFFFNVPDASGDAYLLDSLSGAPKEAAAGFPLPRVTPIFAPTFTGEGVVRIVDVRKDPRFSAWGPQPNDHLPVVSSLAVPVISQTAGVLGGLFFAHREPDQFTPQHERVIAGVAGLAAIALDNAQLYESLQKVNRIKDEFLATLSHELRTPLNAILGWSHMLRTGILQPATQQRAIDAIERNARMQAQLVEDLLDVSRIISGKLRMKSDPIPIEPVIEAAVDTVRPSAVAKDVSVQVGIDPDTSIIVRGDAARLQQIVWNLLSNAVKFTPAGGRVHVELRHTGPWVELVVRDTGEGVATDFLPHMFERFRQSDSRPSRRHGGLGLGLAIVRHLAEAHGGTVGAASEGVGRGAVFTITLPIESIGHRPAQAPPAPSVEAPVLARRHVLVVDDEADARDLTGLILTARGAAVTAVGSAGEALHRLHTQHFDALVADIGMPDEDGYVLIRAVRALPPEEGGVIPAVALTAYATLHDRDEALRAGYDWHVPKPADPKELVAAVASVILARTPPADASPASDVP